MSQIAQNDLNQQLARLRKKIEGDGPAERQVLLLKLVHEFENAPIFGDVFNGDAKSPAQQWISRVGALLSRISIQRKLEFQSINRTTGGYWKHATQSLMRAVSGAIEELKLELELDGRDQIGHVYEPSKQYDFFTDLKGIVLGAKDDIFVVDAYFDASAFDAYLSAVGNNPTVRILCSRYANDLTACVTAFTAQTGAKVEVRKSKDIHDRVIFLDTSDCWIVGASIKDAGKKPTYLIPLAPQLSQSKLAIYENIWSQAS